MKKVKSFTLIEVLVVTGILSLIIIGLYSVVRIANISYSTDAVLTHLAQQTRQVMFWITKDMREATEVDLVITEIDDLSDEVEFAIKSETGNDIVVRYYKDDGQILREEAGQTPRPIADDIVQFKVEQDNADEDKVYINLIAEKESLPGRTLSFPLTERFWLRN